MTRPRLVVVGNGMAGIRTVEELLALTPDLYDTVVFGSEPHGNYNRILLSPVLAGEKTVNDIMLNGVDWYAKHGITLHAGKTVTTIHRRKKVVEAADGELLEIAPEAVTGGRLDHAIAPFVLWRISNQSSVVVLCFGPTVFMRCTADNC